MQRSAEFVVACSNAAELLELIEEAFDVVDLSGQVGFAQLDAYTSTEINDAPIKTEEIAAKATVGIGMKATNGLVDAKATVS
jgi:hypothetical protein